MWGGAASRAQRREEQDRQRLQTEAARAGLELKWAEGMGLGPGEQDSQYTEVLLVRHGCACAVDNALFTPDL